MYVILQYHLHNAQSRQSARLYIQSSELGHSPTPSPPGECAPSTFGSGGEDTLACGSGVGGVTHNSDEGTDTVVL